MSKEQYVPGTKDQYTPNKCFLAKLWWTWPLAIIIIMIRNPEKPAAKSGGTSSFQ